MEYKRRSLEQHRAEWFYYQTIAEYTGYTAYEIYEEMTKRFLLTIDEDGDFAVIRPSSLSTVEHNAYMEQIRCFASTILSIILPDPDKYEKIVNQFILKKI